MVPELEALDEAPFGVGYFDRDLRFVWVNATLATMNGRGRQAHVGVAFQELLGAQPHVGNIVKIMRSVIDTGVASRKHVLEGRRSDGTFFSFSASYEPWRRGGEIVGLVAIVEDHSARRLAEEELLHSEETLRLATEVAEIGTWIWSPGTGALEWSRRTKQIYGMPDDADVDYARYVACLPAEERSKLEELVRKTLSHEGPPTYTIQHRIVRASDGAIRWLQAHARAVFDESGAPIRLLGTTVDVTDSVVAQEQLRAASRAKDEFLAILGHELRNPLAPITTALELMKMKAGADVQARAVIERQVRHLTRLVDDLLDVARIAQGRIRLEKDLVSIDDVVERAIEQASPLLEERRHHVMVEVPRGLMVRGDVTRLAQVVCNLLTNAAKYTPSGGHVSVAAMRDGDHVDIRVRDDGVGIAPELLPRMFDLFTQGEQRLDRAHGGLGLGLAIVKNLVEMHGGRVEAFSEGAGRGAEVRVRLPLEADRVSAAPSTDPRERATKPWGLRVLVVDDNADAAELLALALSSSGWDAEVALDGPSALASIAAAPPTIAVLDIGLPVMDGYELARRIREKHDIPLVAVTGYGQSEDRARTKAAGFDAHLVKPVDLDALERTLRDLLAR